MVELAFVPNLVTRGRHLHKYQAVEETQDLSYLSKEPEIESFTIEFWVKVANAA